MLAMFTILPRALRNSGNAYYFTVGFFIWVHSYKKIRENIINLDLEIKIYKIFKVFSNGILKSAAKNKMANKHLK